MSALGGTRCPPGRERGHCHPVGAADAPSSGNRVPRPGQAVTSHEWQNTRVEPVQVTQEVPGSPEAHPALGVEGAGLGATRCDAARFTRQEEGAPSVPLRTPPRRAAPRGAAETWH